MFRASGLALAARVGAVAELIVAVVTEGDVDDAEVAEFADIGEIQPNRVAIFDRGDDGQLAGCLGGEDAVGRGAEGGGNACVPAAHPPYGF